MNVKTASTGGFRMAGCVLDGGDIHMAAMAAVVESPCKARYVLACKLIAKH